MPVPPKSAKAPRQVIDGRKNISRSRNKDKDLHPPSIGSPAPRFHDKRTWALALYVVAITFAVYYPVLNHPFVNYDDPDYVTENPHVQEGLTFATLTWAVTSTAQANWHPLTWLSHASDYDLFSLNPAGHHLTSLLLHAANGALLFLFLQWITGATWRSMAVAALFALHPINVESVAWVAERKTVLSMFFFLLTLGTYAWYARKPNLARYLVVCALFVLALAAKPMVVTLPFVALLLDFWPLQRLMNGSPPAQSLPVPQFSLRRLLMEKIPLLALASASCIITLLAQRPAMKDMVLVPLRARLVNALFSYGMYVWKTFWPLDLGIFYAPRGADLPAWQLLGVCLFLLAISALVWRERSRRYLVVGWLWFLGTLVPMIGLIQVGEQGMADRYAYLPLLGIFVMLVWGVADLAASKNIDVRISATAAIAILLLLSWLTRRQLQTWESSYTLWSHSLLITPENYVAEDFVGSTLLQDGFKTTGQGCVDEALLHFQNAVRINPQDSLGHLNVGFCRQARGRMQEAIEEYKSGLQFARNKYLKSRACLNLGAAYQETGDFATSRQYYNEALRIYPRDPDILLGVAKLDAAEKIAGLSRSAEQHPNPTVYFQLGQMQAETGLVAEARASYQRVLSLDPNFSQARAALHDLDDSHH
jgi:protein O-mannosyl-transferase